MINLVLEDDGRESFQVERDTRAMTRDRFYGDFFVTLDEAEHSRDAQTSFFAFDEGFRCFCDDGVHVALRTRAGFDDNCANVPSDLRRRDPDPVRHEHRSDELVQVLLEGGGRDFLKRDLNGPLAKARRRKGDHGEYV